MGDGAVIVATSIVSLDDAWHLLWDEWNSELLYQSDVNEAESGATVD
jgi:hypothetical protein